jgi:hypothetical protein
MLIHIVPFLTSIGLEMQGPAGKAAAKKKVAVLWFSNATTGTRACSVLDLSVN